MDGWTHDWSMYGIWDSHDLGMSPAEGVEVSRVKFRIDIQTFNFPVLHRSGSVSKSTHSSRLSPVEVEVILLAFKVSSLTIWGVTFRVHQAKLREVTIACWT